MNWTDLNESMLTKLWGKQWWIEYISWCKCVWTLVNEMHWQRQPFAMLLLSYHKCDFWLNFMFYFKLMLSIYQGHYNIQFIYSFNGCIHFIFSFTLAYQICSQLTYLIFDIPITLFKFNSFQIIHSFTLLTHSNYLGNYIIVLYL